MLQVREVTDPLHPLFNLNDQVFQPGRVTGFRAGAPADLVPEGGLYSAVPNRSPCRVNASVG